MVEKWCSSIMTCFCKTHPVLYVNEQVNFFLLQTCLLDPLWQKVYGSMAAALFLVGLWMMRRLANKFILN